MYRQALRLLPFVLVVLSTSPGPGYGFEQAMPGRDPAFPMDHGKHRSFQTEWWYFTGNVESPEGREFGFQLTFFRRSLTERRSKDGSAWSVRDVYPAHFALVDVKTGRFFHTELISREGPGLAEAAPDRLFVRVKDWQAEQSEAQIHLKARKDGYAVDLVLDALKPVALHGLSGFSRKGDNHSQASYYYSFTRLEVGGSLTFDGVAFPIKGLAWMDHEFGSSILRQDQAGWDWFSLQLDDGSELMLFHLRKKDGKYEQAFGTLVEMDGRTIDLHGEKILISATGTWTSPVTKAVYPSGWSVKIPGKGMSLMITTPVNNQELSASRSTGIVYWEGTVRANGTRDGKPVSGKGYVELTGYAHSMAGRL